MSSRRVLLAALLTTLGCEDAAPVPDKPTWADDVQPLLRGNCFHCHGANAKVDFDTLRWDVYDLTDPVYADLGFMPNAAFVSASTPVHVAQSIGLASDPKETTRMPPPPATRLTPREIEILQKWNDTDRAKGAHHPNHKPTISWVKKPTQYLVNDADGDQVLGKLTCDGMDVPVPRNGTLTLPEGITLPCEGTLYDGFEPAAVTLK
jgi:mono/diheme cytochrome c family protein